MPCQPPADRFLKNEAIKILLPDKLRSAGNTMRMFGMGRQVDGLEVGMNRAAKQAAPKAKQMFLDALMRMSINDARQILRVATRQRLNTSSGRVPRN